VPLSRRGFLEALAGSAFAWPLVSQAQGTPEADSVFAHGVASGDPGSNGVVIWTRVTPPPALASRNVNVRWEVTTDSPSPLVVRSGATRTSAARDFTVKIDVGGLQPGRPYQYRFTALGESSAVGRTRTLPAMTRQARLAVVSCSNYPAGFFNAYAAIALRQDLDAVVHLGDYIYEFADGVFGDGAGIGREPDPVHETITLDDYRRRYAVYRRDPDLQALHRQHPFIAIWDDHEFADNAWAGGSGSQEIWHAGGWNARRDSALRAYLEWMPIREPRRGASFALYRSFDFGTLATLAMLDTRSDRDGQVNRTDDAGIRDPRRRLMGVRQERWLTDGLMAAKASGTTWSLIGQQVMFSHFTVPGQPIRNPDAWDGYRAERSRVTDLLAQAGNAVVLTGDMHSSWAFDVPRDPWSGYRADTGEGSIAVELIAPAVSSPPYLTADEDRTIGTEIRRSLPHLKYLEGMNRGYLLVDLTPARLEASWHFTPDVRTRSTETRLASTVIVDVNSTRVSTGS
jgi:alkaline phosphatase D